MMNKKEIRLILAVCLTTILICAAAFGTLWDKEKQSIIEMETINASNSFYDYVEALEIYGNNLQILSFEKESQVYAYKLNESIGMLKRGSDALSDETYGKIIPEGLKQAMRELSRQLTNFTYRFIDIYPNQSPETDELLLRMASQIYQTAIRLDESLETSKAEPWVKNPVNKDEWIIDKGYRIEKASAGNIIAQIKELLEENEKLIESIEWEQ